MISFVSAQDSVTIRLACSKALLLTISSSTIIHSNGYIKGEKYFFFGPPTSARFFGKNPHQAKMTKNGQKWPKNKVFGLLKKIMSLVLSGICVK